ncbi:3'-5' exonuclease, partial [Nitrosomonas communis]|uniref:3'-5' exonuclease n=1 Tax=Nitrosomonas communis TaxID=44574 RepID=UPI0026F2BE4E
DIRRVNGSKAAIHDATKYLKWSHEISQGKTVNSKLPRAVEALIQGAMSLQLTGDPRKDWTQVKRLLRESDRTEINHIASALDYLIAFNRGKRIAANLSVMWINEGSYVRAREALDSALIEDQLLAGVDDLRGIHVMTIHKSKGKQFDAVIIVREGQRYGINKWRSSFVWRDDPIPHHRSRKILRVGITRAKYHVLMLEPFYPNCPIMTPHKL